jgi:PAS domain S-box-containing protein
LQPDTAEEHDLTLNHKEGHDIWTIIAVKTLSDKNGAFNGVIATITDVTRWHNDEARIKTLNDELKENNLILEQLVAERTAELDQTHQNLLTQIQERSQSESTLKTTEAKFETLLNQAPTAILITDAQGTIQLSNSQATKTLGYTPEELVGASLNEFIPENEASNHTKNRRKLLQANNSQTIHLDINLKRRNGTTFPAQLNMAIIQVQEGWLIAYFIIDITNRKDVEATLTAQTNQLKKSNEELQDFAYIVSHDLRAPLRALNTYSRFLAEDYNDILDAEGHEYISGIAESARHMDILIAGLLAYARIDRPAQNPTLVNVNELLNRLVHNLEPNQIAAITLPNNAPLVWAHEIQLQQIFSNLIDNAIKFSQPNNVSKIVISCEEEEEDFFTFSVADNGIGIESRYFDKIFGIFQRLHTYEEYEGTGIGLAIVKKAVEKHGGQIWVDSVFNEGTTISFTLPKKPQLEPVVQPEEEK